jgi:hypothetical protein
MEPEESQRNRIATRINSSRSTTPKERNHRTMWTWRTSWWTSHIVNDIGKIKSFDDSFRLADGTKCSDLHTRQRRTPAQSATSRRAVHPFIPARHLFSCKSSKRRSDDHLSERGQSHGYQQWQQVWKFTQTRNREPDSKAKKTLILCTLTLQVPCEHRA